MKTLFRIFVICLLLVSTLSTAHAWGGWGRPGWGGGGWGRPGWGGFAPRYYPYHPYAPYYRPVYAGYYPGYYGYGGGCGGGGYYPYGGVGYYGGGTSVYFSSPRVVVGVGSGW